MTRKEEIEKEAIKQCTFKVKGIDGYVDTIDSTQYKAFIAGAQWADETMIDKAYEWLKDNAKKYIYKDVEDWGEVIKLDIDDLTETFRKSMEE